MLLTSDNKDGLEKGVVDGGTWRRLPAYNSLGVV